LRGGMAQRPNTKITVKHIAEVVAEARRKES
jgi:hypothetical protein